MTSGQSRWTPSPGTMPKSKWGLSWNTVSGVARMMSVSSAYSECSSTGPFKAAIIGDSMSRMFKRNLAAFAQDLVVALRAEEIEALRADCIHESVAATGQDHYAIVVVLTDRVEQMDELLVGMAVEEQLAAVSVQGDFEHAIGLAAEAGVRERLTIGVERGHWGLLSEKLFHCDRQLAHSFAGRVIDGIGDRGRHRHGGKLPEALGSEWARFLVELANEERLELRDIRIRRYEVAGIVAVEEAAPDRIGLRLLEQRLPGAPDDPADGLTSSGLGIDDAAGVVGADEAVQAHQAKIGVDAYFGEHGGEAEDRLRSLRLFDWIVIAVAHERGESVARQQLGIRDLQSLSRQHQPTVADEHVVANGTGERRVSAGQGQINCPVARSLRRQHDRGTRVRHRRRADGRVRGRQSRVSQPHGHLLRRQPERVGGHLLHARVRAGRAVGR